ncbi:large subunit ribosomal protein L10 [Desulfobaculum xiamenense]|uniref:Large ribosomal subunit protein uL10 n=1 Tax=Desulfobaculum xiamenense TaxID=995050 RepID=A0A846QN58_9BACT|nr:large subunit ribosomal protein L10 [Desulfobaculum xiamenense]
MNRAEKAELISQLKAKAEDASIAIVTDFKGLKVEEMTDLRIKLRAVGVNYAVVKNTLARIALDGGPHALLKDSLKENCAVAFGYDDPVAAAKVLSEYAKSNKKFAIKFGSLEGKALSEEAIESLSKLPSKPELLGKLLGTMNAVPTNFVCLFANLQRKFLYALSAIKEQKEGAAA